MAEIRDIERSAAALLLRPSAADAIEAKLGVKLPPPGRWTQAGEVTLVRTAPHQAVALGSAAGVFEELDAALSAHAGVIDLSDARAAVVVTGPDARDVLTKLLPIDLHPAAMRAGHAASTLASHMSVLVLQRDDVPSYEILCSRSFARALGEAVRTCSGHDYG